MNIYDYCKSLDPREHQMPSEEYMAKHQDPRDPPYSILVFQDSMEEAIELIDRLKEEIGTKDVLLLRAADTLEDEFGSPSFEGRDLSERHPWNLIIELRKAADGKGQPN